MYAYIYATRFASDFQKIWQFFHTALILDGPVTRILFKRQGLHSLGHSMRLQVDLHVCRASRDAEQQGNHMAGVMA